MLDEIVPVSKVSKTSKVLSADPAVADALPEVDSKISFLPLINYLKEKRPDVSEIKQSFYNHLVKKFEAVPELLRIIHDHELLLQNSHVLELLGTMLFPVVSKHERNNFALA